jgi:hypothetical protein
MLKTDHKIIVLTALFFYLFTPASYAEGGKEFFSSLLLPTTGQAMNGELGANKTKLMAGVEVAAITAITILGIASGGGVVLFGAAPLAANHLWSATDAYKSARTKQDPVVQQEMYDAQRDLELSRERRFEREQNYRSSIRERIQRASETAE